MATSRHGRVKRGTGTGRDMFSTQAMVFSAVVPSLLLLRYFQSRDAYPEPSRVIWTTFLLGVLVTLPILALEWPLLLLTRELKNPYLVGLVSSFLVAAVPEETFKLLVLLVYTRKQSDFDEPMDGLVYGVAASLGFATVENLLYVVPAGYGVALLRAFTAVPMHATLGAIMGYHVGQAHFFPERNRSYLFRAWWIPVLLHGAYDFPLLTQSALAEAGRAGEGVWLVGFAGLVLGGQCWWAVRLGRRLYREQARGESVAVTPESSPILSWRHRLVGWLMTGLGGLLATGGGFVLPMLVLAWWLGTVDPQDHGALVAGGILFGAAPLLGGLFLFARGVRLLNRSSSA